MLATVLDKVRLKKNTLLNASAKALPFFNSPVTNYLTSQNSSKLKTASVEPSSITVLTKNDIIINRTTLTTVIMSICNMFSRARNFIS